MKKFGRILKDTFREFYIQSGMFLASGLSFYVLLYCYPLLLLFVALVSRATAGSDRTMAQAGNIISRFLPASEKAVSDALAPASASAGVFGFLTVATFLVFGTFLFGAVRQVLNTVFGVKRTRPFFRGVAVDTLLMVATGVLLALAVGFASLTTIALEAGGRLSFLGIASTRGWAALGHVIAFAFTWTLFYLLYRVAPAGTISRKGLLSASTGGALLFELSKYLFALYAGATKEAAALYGILGGVVFFFFWIYYASSVFVLCAMLGLAVHRAGKDNTSNPVGDTTPEDRNLTPQGITEGNERLAPAGNTATIRDRSTGKEKPANDGR